MHCVVFRMVVYKIKQDGVQKGELLADGFCRGGQLDSMGNLHWQTLLEGYVFLGAGVASFEAELIGVLCLVEGLFSVFSMDSKCTKPKKYYLKHLVSSATVIL